ncbi:hypothetical protein GHK78_04385 [Sinorhizobium meliloti]|uniref:hypothetical protein n=1 Tax=Rhizobium meliloti TaxID=382 RepID=UPI000FD84870|nr:hypothetical protein [Sinorhizobium meliloti]MQX62302.1 hypothetical protein [Sinorhizobium meliloti]RVI62356.1 hypothetical protein CN189_19015 [Sinorhizobium meliloti]
MSVLMAAHCAVSSPYYFFLAALGIFAPVAPEILLSEWRTTSAIAAAPHDFRGKSFSVYALSRGSGVPDAALSVLERVRSAIERMQRENVSVRISEERIGLEGERRLCGEFESEDAARTAWQHAVAIAAGVDLVSLKVEPCPY